MSLRNSQQRWFDRGLYVACAAGGLLGFAIGFRVGGIGGSLLLAILGVLFGAMVWMIFNGIVEWLLEYWWVLILIVAVLTFFGVVVFTWGLGQP